LGLFVEHLVGRSNSKGLKTLSQIKPTPCKHKKINPTNTRTLFSWFVRVTIKKQWRKLGFWGVSGLREIGGGGGMKMGVKKRRRWCGGGQWRLKGAAVVMGSGGWRRNGGFGGVWEKKDGDGRGGDVCTAQ
jgi:hypothetical protein